MAIRRTLAEFSDDIATADIADDAVTTTKIVNDAITGGKLANDIAISTTGNIATTGSGTLAVAGTSTLTGNATAAGNLTVTGDLVPSTPLSHRNMIINGGMQVWQRATAATQAGGDVETVDRFRTGLNGSIRYTSERHAMSLAELNTTGHSYAVKLDCTTASGSPSAAHYSFYRQRIEAQNLQHLQYGTANAKTITLSFWVKSNKTGIYCIVLDKQDSTRYLYVREYTISAANTWEQKTITITPTAGSTSLITAAGGVIDNNTATGLELGFGLQWGTTYNVATNNTWALESSNGYATSNQVNWGDSTSNNFYLTGVQLELGSNATPFEHRSYGDELLRCQRYFCGYHDNPRRLQYALHDINSVNSGNCFAMVYHPVQLRTDEPTFTPVYLKNGSGTNLNNTNFAPFVTTGNQNAICIQKKTDNVTTNQTVISVFFKVDAEL